MRLYFLLLICLFLARTYFIEAKIVAHMPIEAMSQQEWALKYGFNLTTEEDINSIIAKPEGDLNPLQKIMLRLKKNQEAKEFCKGDFHCPNSDVCIHPDKICNGVSDCPDSSDEQCMGRSLFEKVFEELDQKIMKLKSKLALVKKSKEKKQKPKRNVKEISNKLDLFALLSLFPFNF